MNERPIIMTGESVRAILENRKAQTRRVIKPQPDGNEHLHLAAWDVPIGMFQFADSTGPIYPEIKCPYGVPGDRLWVRETWAHDEFDCQDTHCENIDHIWWRANEVHIVAESFSGSAGWRSSTFMPRWASRVTLEITGVRVERVQDISEADACAEGCVDEQLPFYSLLEKYEDLWNEINKKRGYGWQVNPWVWVIEFKKVKP